MDPRNFSDSTWPPRFGRPERLLLDSLQVRAPRQVSRALSLFATDQNQNRPRVIIEIAKPAGPNLKEG